jgi:hypothetical protein
MKNADNKNRKEGYSDKISGETLAELLRDYINETTDEEALEIWQMIAKADPNIALKVILDKSEKLDKPD